MNRRFIRPAVIGALAVAAIAGSASARAGSGDASVTAAHLRLTLTTTSDWTQVHIRPGQMVAAHKAAESGTGSYAGLGDGIAVSGVSGTKRVTTDVVLSEVTGASTFSVEIDKGYIGTATVTVTNLNDGTSRQVATVTDTVHNVNDWRNPTVTQLSRQTVIGAVPLALPHGDDRKLVLAFYYPWFGSYDQAALADRPSDARSVWAAAGVSSMTNQAKANGVDGFIVSWHGDAKDGPAFDVALSSAERAGQVISPYIETPSATSSRSPKWADPFVVYNWIQQALNRQSSPAFLKADDGVPVVFVYQMAALSPGEWGGVVDALAAKGQQVHLFGDATGAGYRPLEWGVHRYAALDDPTTLTNWSRAASLSARAGAVVDSAQRPEVYAGTVSPGFDDQALRGLLNPVVSRDDGARYDATWDAALAGDPDWVLVSTWNEWYEDSQIEPGLVTGAQALRQTADRAAAWRAGAR